MLFRSGYNADADNLYPFDLEKAKSILEEAGWIDENGDGVREKDGQKLTIEYPALPAYEEQFMELLAYALQDAGFEVNLTTMDDAGISAAGGAGEHNILNMGWLSRDPSVLSNSFGTPRGSLDFKSFACKSLFTRSEEHTSELQSRT